MKTALEVDRALVEVGESVDLLLHVSPVNAEEAWREFSESGFEGTPAFHYRPLGFDVDACRSRLVILPVEEVEDPALGYLLDEKRIELDRSLTLLVDRETDRFLHGSLTLFGDVDDALMSDAEKVLADVQPQVVRDLIEPQDFCDLARAELDHYSGGTDDLGLEVELRDDVPGMMVAGGKLLVSSGLKIARARADALVQHEVGTHLLTGANGKKQPFGLFAIGLPGYEQTQEGLAIFAEYMSGGLDRARLRLLGARVVAVRRLLDGASFRDVFLELHRDRGFRPKSAWSVTMRVFRAGGFTKDAIYLRGLTEIMNHVRSGGALESLLVGKIGLAHIPLVDELLAREVLLPPTFWPRWLNAEGAAERMGRVRVGVELSDLVNESL